MKIETPKTEHPSGDISIFLAGTIEMGKASMWQNQVREKLMETLHDDVKANITVHNPRRADWDNTIVNDAKNHHFVNQVEWELKNLLNADIVFFYFEPGSQSIITMLELGLVLGEWSREGSKLSSLIVVCPDGFARKGNVDVTVHRITGNYPHLTLEAGLDELMKTIVSMKME